MTTEEKQALCIKCQYCCKVLAFMVEKHPIVDEFYKERELTIEYDKQSNRYFVTIPHVCPKLTEHGCAVFAHRPYACRIFDGRNFVGTAKRCLWPVQ